MQIRACVCVVVLAGLCGSSSGDPVLPVLGYQGVLEQNGQPYTGTADIEIRLWDSLVGGSPASSPTTYLGRQVTGGRFTVSPNFGGDVYNGDRRFVEFKVDGVTLSPRQALNPAPLASRVTGIQRNDATGFVGIGRSSRVTSSEVFGLYSPGTGFGGMYIETGDGGRPFYGYSEGGVISAYEYYNPELDSWSLNVGSGVAQELRYDGTGELFVPKNIVVGEGLFNYPIEARSSSNFVIFGESTGPSGNGVTGFAEGEFGTGVSGVGNGSSSEGIRGVQNGATGWAGRFLGDVLVEDQLSVGFTDNSPSGKKNNLWVVDALNTTANPAGHVAMIENVSTGTSPDVLAIKINSTDLTPGVGVNFITFFNDADASLGSIQGNNAGSVELAGAGNDYAEWLEQVSETEEMGPGCVVGVRGGKISLDTSGADQVMVVSTSPLVTGNRPFEDDEGVPGWQRVAFIGQAPVKVRGPVLAGQFLVPSGRNDGTAVAVNGYSITPERLTQVLGVAWEGSAAHGEGTVNAAVGIDQADANAYVLRAQAERIDELEARLVRLERAIAE